MRLLGSLPSQRLWQSASQTTVVRAVQLRGPLGLVLAEATGTSDEPFKPISHAFHTVPTMGPIRDQAHSHITCVCF